MVNDDWADELIRSWGEYPVNRIAQTLDEVIEKDGLLHEDSDAALMTYLLCTSKSHSHMIKFLEKGAIEEVVYASATPIKDLEETALWTEKRASYIFHIWLDRLNKFYKDNEHFRPVTVEYVKNLMFSTSFDMREEDFFEFYGKVRGMEVISENLPLGEIMGISHIISEETGKPTERKDDDFKEGVMVSAYAEWFTDEDLLSLYAVSVMPGFTATQEFLEKEVKRRMSAEDIVENAVSLYLKTKKNAEVNDQTPMLYIERSLGLLKRTHPEKLKESGDKILGRLNLSTADNQHIYNISHGTNHLKHLFRYSNN